jgi:hypothetical protein
VVPARPVPTPSTSCATSLPATTRTELRPGSQSRPCGQRRVRRRSALIALGGAGARHQRHQLRARPICSASCATSARMTLEGAVQRITSRPAHYFGLARGASTRLRRRCVRARLRAAAMAPLRVSHDLGAPSVPPRRVPRCWRTARSRWARQLHRPPSWSVRAAPQDRPNELRTEVVVPDSRTPRAPVATARSVLRHAPSSGAAARTGEGTTVIAGARRRIGFAPDNAAYVVSQDDDAVRRAGTAADRRRPRRDQDAAIQ